MVVPLAARLISRVAACCVTVAWIFLAPEMPEFAGQSVHPTSSAGPDPRGVKERIKARRARSYGVSFALAPKFPDLGG